MNTGVKAIDVNFYMVDTLAELLGKYGVIYNDEVQIGFDASGNLSGIGITYKNLKYTKQLSNFEYCKLKEDLYNKTVEVSNEYDIKIQYVCIGKESNSNLIDNFMYLIEIEPNEVEIVAQILEGIGISI